MATDVDYSPVSWAHEQLLDNLGDPFGDTGRWPRHTKEVEREVVALFAALFGGTTTDGPGASWGYVTAGGSSEGVLHGLWLGRRRFPDARVYYSTAAHDSTATAAELLGLPTSVIAVDDADEIGYEALARALRPHRHRAALVVATIGTAMTEAIDDVAAIHQVLDEAGVARRHIVVDAALSGPGLAAAGDQMIAHLLADHPTLGRSEADAVTVSGHTSFGTPHVCAVALTRREHLAGLGGRVNHRIDTTDTVSDSRPGHAPVELWHAWHALGGPVGLARRAASARALAVDTVDRLTALGWPAWRHPHAWTVVLAAPPSAVCTRWALPEDGGRARIVCMPGVTRADIGAFLTDLSSEHPG